ncbi:hypothetical protein HY78_03830 [Rhizorhabdus wittichii DC-6]|uniref:Uncharacterized protein n=1 Tax=Rhizorhabdus wittichii (strain DSM 6014 / CCUG 31198 / JCM 15750 / NBRC 105917 / EY 4224 / RW1) TaxID=392499 RepID=A0A9J9HEW9_RHIWR|nr:hypothetical protein Swit_4068 [Rhizorhabdus wittichii RW1]ARR52636.1 hypothetical protein HY78_03830 [Rhizorhabdus wittichii DC-6]
MATIAPPAPTITAFPKNDVIKALVDELLDVARTEAQLRGIALPKDEAGIRNAPVPLDSLSIVDTLCAVEAVIGFELRDNIVQTGGYVSVEEALAHLVPRIEKVWIKKKGAKP